MDLIAIATQLGTDEQCLAFIETMRWENGVRCVKCDSDRISKFTTKEGKRKSGRIIPARHLYECLVCGEQFAATTGTLFHDTHLPLQKWFFAVALMVNAKKGLSARQMKRDLGVTYKTAWFLCHRIREAMQSEGGIFGGTVEIDETYVGGKYNPRGKRGKYQKQAVIGVVQRSTPEENSKVQTKLIPNRSKNVIAEVVKDHVSFDAAIMTDEWSGYRHLNKSHNHAIVIHSCGEYVRGDVHTNNIEGFWSLVKRQIIGQHHFVSVKHLQRYLNEVSFKFNNREEESLFLLVLLNLLIGSALPYAKLTAPVSAS